MEELLTATNSGSLALPSGQPEKGAYREVVERLFNPLWLAEPGPHRLQRLWHRTDQLASEEVASLGFAIEALAEHREWLRHTARIIRRSDDGCQGLLFEIIGLGGFAAAGASVQPQRVSHATYDGEVRLPDGNVLRVSVKNHDLSFHEARFRDGCEELARLVAASTKQAGRSFHVAAGSVGHMGKPAFEAIERVIQEKGLLNAQPHARLLDGEVGLNVRPLSLPGALAGSHIFFVRSPAHANEQLKFASRLRDAVQKLAASPLSVAYTNVVLMRVHATADVTALSKLAEELLGQPGCTVDAVCFYQAVVTRKDGGWSISFHGPSVTTQRFRERGIRLKLALLSGQAIVQPSVLEVTSQIGPMQDLTGQYVYQRGDLLHQGTLLGRPVGGVSIGPGIRSTLVTSAGPDQPLFKGAISPQDEELLVL